VHAQVSSRGPRGLFGLQRGVDAAFGEAGPTVSIIPCIEHGLAPYDGKIEINVIAAKPAARPASAMSTPAWRPRSVSSRRP